MQTTDTYRQAASVLLLRKLNTPSPEFLLLHKPRKNDAWQLPQGGMEHGETVAECALRELEEESGISGAEVVGQSAEAYQYDFPASYRRFRPDHICGQHIRFVFAVCPAECEMKLDENEVDEAKWVNLETLPQYIKRDEYRGLVERLYKEAMEVLREE